MKVLKVGTGMFSCIGIPANIRYLWDFLPILDCSYDGTSALEDLQTSGIYGIPPILDRTPNILSFLEN